ncbi:MAG TPA: PEP-CTERM sorting domain-containing protein [Steroidobacteraceae bacterium]|nr:PEP-CTERM sorting domain-containing protein [Steroidobacteraceae bacterium]
MKHKRIVTVSLIAVPVIAGVSAYLVRQSDSAAASQTEIPAAVPTVPAALQPTQDVTANGVQVTTPPASRSVPANAPAPQPQQRTEDPQQDEPSAYASNSDSASFAPVEHLALANSAESLPNESSANVSPNGRFSPPLMLTYPGGLGSAGGHRQSNQPGSTVSESGSQNNVPSNGGTSDAKNTPSQSSLESHPGDDSEHHSNEQVPPSHDEDHDGTVANNDEHHDSHDALPPTHPNNDEHHDSHDALPPTHPNNDEHHDSHDGVPPTHPTNDEHHEGTPIPPTNDPIPPLVFNDEPHGERPVQVPEPGTLGLLGLGLLGLAGRRKAKK